MKKLLLALAVAAMATTGCETTHHSTKPATMRTLKRNPQPGMTMQEITELYGQPKEKKQTGDGEEWIYDVRKGEAGIAFEPGYNPKTRQVYFGTDGKVKRWSFKQ